MKHLSFIVGIDSYLFRKGMTSIIRRLPAAVHIKEFDSEETLAAWLRNHDADVLVLGETFTDLIYRLIPVKPGLNEKCILLTRERETGTSLGIQYFIHPDQSKEEIFSVFEEIIPSIPASTKESDRDLTPRERNIVRMVSLGHTNRKIAEKLFLSTHTVITHRKNINSKLGIRSVSGLTVYAIVNNIITIDEVASEAES
jgi:DNA-binding NarL/FixJ family response regulator